MMHTTNFDMTLEEATLLAYCWSKGVSMVDGRDQTKSWGIEYNTAIPGTPHNSYRPNHCWAVTNKFDPNVRAAIGGK